MLVHPQPRLPPEVAVVVILEVELEGGFLVGGGEAERRLPAPPRDARGPVEEILPRAHLVDGLGDLGVRPGLVSVGGDREDPLQQSQMKRAAALHAVRVGVRRPLVRDHRLEAGRVQRGGLELDPRLVGHAVRPDLAVTGGVSRDPFDRVVPVLRFLHEGEEVPRRGESAPGYRDHRDVSVPREEHRVLDRGRTHLVVGGPREDGGKWPLQRHPVLGGQVEVRHEFEAVAHGDRHVLDDDDISFGPHGEAGIGRFGAAGRGLQVKGGTEPGHPRAGQTGLNERSAIHPGLLRWCETGMIGGGSPAPLDPPLNLRSPTAASRRWAWRSSLRPSCAVKRPRRRLDRPRSGRTPR